MGSVESSVSWIDQVLPPHLTLQDNFLSTSKHPTTDWAGLSERQESAFLKAPSKECLRPDCP